MTVTIPTLETERLVLRCCVDADHAAMADFFANDKGAEFVGGPCDARQAWRVLATFVGHWYLRGYGPFALEDRATGTWIGWCAIWRPPEFPEIEIGYTLREAWRGKGLVTEAASRVRTYAFETLKLPTLVSYIRPDNAPSKQVARRLGARLEGTIELRATEVEVWRHPKQGAAG